jgi:hypothetical protein
MAAMHRINKNGHGHPTDCTRMTGVRDAVRQTATRKSTEGRTHSFRDVRKVACPFASRFALDRAPEKQHRAAPSRANRTCTDTIPQVAWRQSRTSDDSQGAVVRRVVHRRGVTIAAQDRVGLIRSGAQGPCEGDQLGLNLVLHCAWPARSARGQLLLPAATCACRAQCALAALQLLQNITFIEHRGAKRSILTSIRREEHISPVTAGPYTPNWYLTAEDIFPASPWGVEGMVGHQFCQRTSELSFASPQRAFLLGGGVGGGWW